MSEPPTLDWWRAGERFLACALSRLSDADFESPSLLPGWPRRTVIAHAAHNADALVNLLTWGRTGKEMPMYSPPEARDTALAEAVALPAARLRADAAAARDRLADAIENFPKHAWAAEVRTAQGRTVPTSEVPWMRCREVWVHAVDLDAGPSFDDVPESVLVALVEDVQRMWQRRDQTPPVMFTDGSRTWGFGSHIVSGTLPSLAARVTGRAPGAAAQDIPIELPAWL